MMKKMGTVGGLLLGLLSIFGAFFSEGGSFKALFLLPALLIVFGGTFSATIIGVGFENFKNIFALIKLAYFPREYDERKLIDTFVYLSTKARKEGFLAIERDLYRLDHVFPKKLMRYVLEGTDPEALRSLAELEMKSLQGRHFSNINIFTKMGGYAPTMGIIGTVMGLIMTLANAGSNPDMLIHSIATAFIATLWGIFSANIFWLPIADRLKKCHLEEKNMMEMSLEAVLTLQSGEIPSIVKARLQSMLPQKDQLEVIAI